MQDQQFTALSQRAWEGIAESASRPGDAVRFFSERMAPRSFAETLRAFLRRQGIAESELPDRLAAVRPGVKRDSLRRRVSSWLSGGRPSDREELIGLGFALGLSGEEAENFLSVCGDGGFHLREPREAAFLYSLRAGKSYEEALALIARLPNAGGPFPADAESAPSAFTRTVADRLAEVTSDEEFLRFYEESLPVFGKLHNTAFLWFSRFFDELRQPSAPCGAEEDASYSVERAIELYLRLNVPASRNEKSFSQLQKATKRLWPNATAIKNMLARKLDVSRKTLLLLYVATEGLDDGAIEEAMGWEPDSPDEILEEHVWNCNLMLHECGFSPLDPRSPFDWLVLYSLRPGDGEDESMSDRLSQVLALLFGDGREVDADSGAPC